MEEKKKSASRHYMVGTPEYDSWRNMKLRCYNPNHSSYKNYGGRGIKVCKRWLHFKNFYKDMMDKPTPKHTLDRTDNDGNYKLANCRWVTKKEQALNRRSNKLLTFKGETKTQKEWSDTTGLHRETIYSRIKRGWSIEDTLTLPPRNNGKNNKNNKEI